MKITGVNENNISEQLSIFYEKMPMGVQVFKLVDFNDDASLTLIYTNEWACKTLEIKKYCCF